MHEVQSSKAPIRLFKSDFLEFFTHIHPHWVYPLFAAFVTGYIGYDITHYSSHHFNLKSRYLKLILPIFENRQRAAIPEL